MKYLISLIFVSICLNAQIDKDNVVERGWRFGELDTNKNVKTKQQKSPTELLEELVKIQKESLEIQKIMLKKFDDYIDPKPKMITLKNGKKCIENSSSECFKMPLTNVAKKLPVLKEMVLNPSKKSLAEWYKWQSTYFNKIHRVGTAASLAMNGMSNLIEKGTINRYNYKDAMGRDKANTRDYKEYILVQNKDHYSLDLFFGINKALDKEIYKEFIRFINMIDNVKYNVYFYNIDSKISLEIMAKTDTEIQKFLNNAKTVQLNRSIFKKTNIYTTPMLYAKVGKNMDAIAVAKVSKRYMVNYLLDYLVYQNVLNPNYLQDFKIWKFIDEKDNK